MFGMSLLTTRLIAYGIIVAVILGFAGYVKYQWDSGQAAKTELHAVKAQEKANTAAITSVDQPAAKTETSAQAALQASARVIIKRIPTYVHVSTPGAPVPCIPWGFVRLHDAAVLGVDPADLPNPSGAADDACSTVAYPDLAGVVADNYAAARANAEQLNALEDLERNRAKAVSAASAR